MPGLTWKDLPKVVEDTDEDKAFYNALGDMPDQKGEFWRISDDDKKNLLASLKKDRNNDGMLIPAAFNMTKPDDGFEPFIPAGGKDKDGFEPFKAAKVDGDGFEPFKAKTDKDGFEPFQKGRGVGDYLTDLGKEVVNIPNSMAAMTASHIAGPVSQLFGNSPEEADKLMTEIKDKYGHIKEVGKPEGQTFLDTIIGGAMDVGRGTMRNVGNFMENFIGSLNGDPEAIEGMNKPVNPAAEQIAGDLATLAGGRKVEEAVRGPATVDGTATRIPDNTLPPPEGGAPTPPPRPNAPAGGIAEAIQKTQAEKASMEGELLDRYGMKGKDVNTEEAVNPYFAGGHLLDDPAMAHDPKTGYMVLNDAFENLSHLEEKPKQQESVNPEGTPEPEAKPGPSYEKLQAMRKQGNEVIQKIEDEGLSIQQVHDQFWNNTYKELPAEVQQRFQTLRQKATEREGLIPAAKPSDTAGMARWYTALMYLANNYAWGPKSAGALENKADIQQIIDPEAKGWNNIDPKSPHFTTDLDSMVFQHVMEQQGNGGSINKILEHLAQSLADPELRSWARLLHDPENDMVLRVLDSSQAARPSVKGTAKLRVGMEPEIMIYKSPGESIDPLVVLHEAFHGRTQTLFEVGRDTEARKKYPEIARMYDEYADMMIATMKALPEEMKKAYRYAFTHGNAEKAGSLGHEFGAYAISSPGFWELLKDITLSKDGKSAMFELTRHGFRTLGRDHPAFQNIPWDEIDAAADKVSQKIALEDAASNSALKELFTLLAPIIEANKGKKFPVSVQMEVFDSSRGWLNNGEIFDDTYTKADFDPTSVDMIDPKSNQKRVYHGTSKDKDFSKFKDNPRGIFVTESPEDASAYATDNDSMKVVYEGGKYIHKNTASRVIPMNATMEKTYKLSPEEEQAYKHATNYAAFQRQITFKAKAQGYDSIDWGGGVYSVFSAKQLDSAISQVSLGPEMIKRDLPAKDIIRKMISPYTSIDDLVRDFVNKDFRDFPDAGAFVRNWYPIMMAKNIIGNPLATFGAQQLRKIEGDTHALLRALEDSIKEFTKAKEDVQNRIVTALNQINRPEVQALLIDTRARQTPQGAIWSEQPNALDLTPQEAQQFGMTPEDFQLYKGTLEPLFKTLYAIDRAMLQKAFGRTYQTSVIGYFPRTFGYGPFIVKGYDLSPNGDKRMVFFRRFPTFVEQKLMMQELERGGYLVEKEQGRDYNSFFDLMLGLIEIDPNNPVSKEAQSFIQKMEEHKRSQEFERSANNVVGYVGTQINNPNELKLLRHILHTRVRGTADLYKAARIRAELTGPLAANPILHRNWPNAVAWIGDLTRRALGGDISRLPWIDKFFQIMFEGLNKAQMLLRPSRRKLLLTLSPTVPQARRKGVKRPKHWVTEQTLAPDAQRDIARLASSIGSAYALAGNVPNMLTNALTMPIIGVLGGAVDEFIMSKDVKQQMKGIGYAIDAQADGILDYLEYIRGKVSDKQVDAFMKEIEKRGYLTPAMYDDVKDLKTDVEKGVAVRKLARAAEFPKKATDLIETNTNIITFLYYNRLIRKVHPNLSRRTHMEMVLEFSKNYTGDYGQWNRALMFDKAGFIGRLNNNFAVWAGTRQGQIHFLLKNLGQGGLPALVQLSAAQIMVAGINGVPFMADYEDLRRWASKMDIMDLPPVDMVLKEAGVPYAMRQGILGEAFGIDVGTRNKWSGWFGMGGATLQLPADLWHMSKAAAEYVMSHGNMNEGVPLEDQVDFVNSMPQGIKGAVQQAVQGEDIGEGKSNIVNRYGKAMYTQNGIGDKIFNIIGFKTAKQGEDMRDTYAEHYKLKVQHKEEKRLEKIAVENALAAMKAHQKGQDALEKHYTQLLSKSLDKYADVAKKPYDKIGEAIGKAAMERTMTPDERREYELSQKLKQNRIPDAIIIQQIIENAQRYGWTPQTKLESPEKQEVKKPK